MTKIFAVTACLLSGLVLAQTVPSSISFNARLSDTAGAPVTGTHALAFGLFDAASGGAAVWTESVSGTFSTDGLVFLELGAVTALTPSALDGRKLFLEVTVDGTAMAPRLGVVSVPYAIRASVAASALTIGSLTESAIQRRVTGTCAAGQAVRSIDAAGGVQCEAIASGDITAVTTAAGTGLTGGAVSGDVALSLVSCANGEVLKSNGTVWACAADAVGSAGISAIGVTSPLVSSGGTSPTLTITTAGPATAGALSSADWATFNNKLSTVAVGAGLSGAGTTGSPLTVIAAYAQAEGPTQTFAANTWTPVTFTSTPIASGIIVQGTNITFANTGVYQATLSFRNDGTCGDVWTAARFFANATDVGHSAGTGTAPPNISTFVFLFNVTNTVLVYQLQVGRLASGCTIISPVPLGGGTTQPAVQATIVKL